MAQAASSSRVSWGQLTVGLAAACAIALVGLAIVFQQQWLPLVRARLSPPATSAGDDQDHAGHDHAGHDHVGHDDANSIELTSQARKNIGLKTAPVTLQSFTRTISVPGMIVERPGRSTVKVTTPMTGIITEIYPIEGESISPGRKLFELRLTHEEIVQAQAELLRTAEELDVLHREIARLEKASADGALPGKTLLERKYEQQKLEAANRSQQQALLLHGLSEAQIQSILKNRALLQGVTIEAPKAVMESPSAGGGLHFQIQKIMVAPGQHVNAGDPLAVLIDYSTLLIEGNAFEGDAALIDKAAQEKSPVSAILPQDNAQRQRIDDLRILYQSSQVDPQTRAWHFYVTLPNEAREDHDAETGRRFLNWRFRPGQRMQLQVPVETWTERIVLPLDAIAQDGVETYVFTPNGDHFDRRPVHIEYRDDFNAVIAADGAIFPGDEVVVSGARQLQLAIKNKAGGAIDPHAGHTH